MNESNGTSRKLVAILARTAKLLRGEILRSPYASAEEKDRMYRSFSDFLDKFTKLVDRSEGHVEWTRTELEDLKRLGLK